MNLSAKITTAVVAAVFGAGVASATDAPLPDYFVQTVIHSTAAESLAQHCDTLALKPETISSDSSTTLDRLLAEGVDVEKASNASIEATNAIIRGGLDAFVAKHGLDGAKPEAACLAGLVEIGKGTPVGRYLREIEQ
jgi:hypothetical protein